MQSTIPFPAWFWEDDAKSWSPYSESLSETLEQLYISKVPSAFVEDGKYEICFLNFTQRNQRTRYTRKILRGTWFWCNDDGINYIPYPADVAAKLENAFLNNLFDLRIDVGGNRFALLHPSGQDMRQYRTEAPNGKFRYITRGYKARVIQHTPAVGLVLPTGAPVGQAVPVGIPLPTGTPALPSSSTIPNYQQPFNPAYTMPNYQPPPNYQPLPNYQPPNSAYPGYNYPNPAYPPASFNPTSTYQAYPTAPSTFSNPGPPSNPTSSNPPNLFNPNPPTGSSAGYPPVSYPPTGYPPAGYPPTGPTQG